MPSAHPGLLGNFVAEALRINDEAPHDCAVRHHHQLQGQSDGLDGLDTADLPEADGAFEQAVAVVPDQDVPKPLFGVHIDYLIRRMQPYFAVRALLSQLKCSLRLDEFMQEVFIFRDGFERDGLRPV
jgi:hypothetical protein